MQLERMEDFFTARAEGYDAHMLKEVGGCREAYAATAALVPGGVGTLLDLGCGTGLELEPIFRRLPALQVTGIDMTPAMLERLRAKFKGYDVRTVCGSYFDVPFGENAFDCAVSFETMHHFSHAAKLGLYAKLCKALKPGGRYVECDYMVLEQAEEDHLYAENDRLRREQGIPAGVFYHFDTPCTVENQLSLLRQAGFARVWQEYRQENTTIVVAER